MLIEIERNVCGHCLDQGTEKCKPDCWAVLGSEVEEERLSAVEKRESAAIKRNKLRHIEAAFSSRRDRHWAARY